MSEESSSVAVAKKTATSTLKHHGPKSWTTGQERELVKLFENGTSIQALAEMYRRNPKAIQMKLKCLGLNVVATKTEMTGELKMAKDLRSLETVLKIVAAAIFKSCQGRLGKTESERLDTIATLYEAYSAGLEQFVGYRKIEAKVLEMEAKYAELAKKA